MFLNVDLKKYLYATGIQGVWCLLKNVAHVVTKCIHIVTKCIHIEQNYEL